MKGGLGGLGWQLALPAFDVCPEGHGAQRVRSEDFCCASLARKPYVPAAQAVQTEVLPSDDKAGVEPTLQPYLWPMVQLAFVPEE